MAKLISWQNLAVCNCAGCNLLLHGENQAAEFAAGKLRMTNTPPVVAARLYGGRPFCAACESKVSKAAA